MARFRDNSKTNKILKPVKVFCNKKTVIPTTVIPESVNLDQRENVTISTTTTAPVEDFSVRRFEGNRVISALPAKVL